MIIRFRPESAEEFNLAVLYYNNERPGLGFELAAEVRNTLNRIIKFPDSWPFISPNIRKSIVNRFPFAVLYHRGDNQILIIAIMHMRRKPGYWKQRVD